MDATQPTPAAAADAAGLSAANAAGDAAGDAAGISAGSDLWSAARIVALADELSQRIGADTTPRARTLFVALGEAGAAVGAGADAQLPAWHATRFVPVCAYPHALFARRAVVGMGMMVVSTLAPAEGVVDVEYKFDVDRAPTARARGSADAVPPEELLEVWTVRAQGAVVARFLLAPSDGVADDLARSEVALGAYTIQTKAE